MKSVIFDVDGVLLDSFETNVKFFQNLMKMAGHPTIERERYRELFHLPMKNVIKIHINGNKEEIERVYNLGRSGTVPYPRDLAKPPEGIEEILKSLKDYKLGVVTSRVGTNWLTKTDLKHVEKYFNAIVTYDDTEKHKPEPEPLLLVAKKLQVNPSDCIYIGDAKSDMIAAKAAGMKIILYNNKTPEADAYTTSFKELPEIIKRL